MNNCIIQEGIKYCEDVSFFQVLGISFIVISSIFFMFLLSVFVADFIADKFDVSEEMSYVTAFCLVFFITGLILVI